MTWRQLAEAVSVSAISKPVYCRLTLHRHWPKAPCLLALLAITLI